MSDNPDEWFDIVDEDNRVIGRERRGIVHKRKLLHRAVHVIVQRANGQIFLQKRSMGKDTNPGRWDSSSSGHLDSGEDYESAARRELQEELGIETDRIEEIGSLPASRETGYEFVRVYRTRHDGPFTLHPEEISGGKWVSIPRLQEWMKQAPEDFPRCFHAVWRAIRNTPGFIQGAQDHALD